MISTYLRWEKSAVGVVSVGQQPGGYQNLFQNLEGSPVLLW